MSITYARLDLRPPFEIGPALAILASQALPDSEIVDLERARHTRLFSVLEGRTVAVTVELHVDHIDIWHRRVEPAAESSIVRRVSHGLDLHAAPAQIAARMGADPVIGALVTARPGLRVIGLPEDFEAAAITVLGQQVSLAAGRTFGARLVARFGSDGDAGLRAFPTPVVLAASSPSELQSAIGVTHARARTVLGLAQAWTAGLRLGPDIDAISSRQALLGIPGIGPWTAESLAVRVIGDRDAYPAGDLVLRRALRVRTETAARAAATAWSPFRSYALFHLWCAELGV